MIKNILRLTRPKQWIKNFFVFIPMFFGGELFNINSIELVTLTFFAYSFIASSIYCYNDIVDVDADRNHPVKCHRPIASGTLSIRMGYTLMIAMFVLGIGVALLLPPEVMSNVMAVIVFYYVLNLAYCSKLKQYAILDVCIVAFGFVLRILAGGFACELPLSNWIVIMTFLLTLFMSFAKRRDDVLRMNEAGGHRARTPCATTSRSSTKPSPSPPPSRSSATSCTACHRKWWNASRHPISTSHSSSCSSVCCATYR